MGHETTLAANGREAVHQFASSSFDLILMDVQMPEMDGFEAVVAIRARESLTGSHIPIIALTAHAMKGDRDRCLSSGFDDYLSKPIRPGELFQAIENFANSPSAPTAAGPAEPDAPAVDFTAALESLGGDRELFNEITRIFLDDAPRKREEIKAAINRRDAQAIRRIAHGLKGASTHFVAPRLVAAAERLEFLGKSEDLTGADDAFAVLESALDRVLRDLEESLTSANTA